MPKLKIYFLFVLIFKISPRVFKCIYNKTFAHDVFPESKWKNRISDTVFLMQRSVHAVRFFGAMNFKVNDYHSWWSWISLLTCTLSITYQISRNTKSWSLNCSLPTKGYLYIGSDSLWWGNMGTFCCCLLVTSTKDKNKHLFFLSVEYI